MSLAPRPNAPPSHDDDAVELPELDGEADAGVGILDDSEATVLVGDDDSPVDLDDEIAAEEAAEAWIEPLADVEADGWETGELDPVEADDELEDGEAEAWTEGSEEDDATTPVDLDVDEAVEHEGEDEGDEGIDDERVEDLELPPMPGSGDRDDDDAYAEDLDVGVRLPEPCGEGDPPESDEVV